MFLACIHRNMAPEPATDTDEVAASSDDEESDRDQMSDEEWEYTFDAIFDVADRWDITEADAEVFLERVGYFDTDRYHEIAEYFEPTDPQHHAEASR